MSVHVGNFSPTDQSDRAPSPNEKTGLLLLGTAEGVRPLSTLLYTMAAGRRA